MIPDIEFRHLSYFIAIAEEGSFGKAAKSLHISQPTLTTQIKHLEESADATLLIRGSRGTGLSPAGLLLLPLARQLLQLRGEATRTISAVHHRRKASFRWGYSPFVSRGLLLEALRAYKELVPEGADGQMSDGSANLAKMVERGQLDAAIVTLPVAGRELFRQVVCSERYMVCLRRDDAFASAKSLSPGSVAANLKIFVNRSQNPLFFEYIQRKLVQAGIHPHVTHLVSTQTDVQFQVLAGNGWGLVHQSLKLDPDLKHMTITGVPLRVRTAFISNKNQEHPMFPLLAFRLAATCQSKRLELRTVDEVPGRAPLRPAS